MSILTTALGVSRRHDRISAEITLEVQPNRHLVARIVTLLFIWLTALIASIIISARTSAVPLGIELPEDYFPGNPLPPLPKEAVCHQSEFAYVFCLVHLFGKEVYLNNQLGTRMIVRTSFRAHEYTVGDLIAIWGTPTGITQHSHTVRIFWGKRSATVTSSPFQPSNLIDLIIYDFEPQHASPWHGFTSSKP